MPIDNPPVSAAIRQLWVPVFFAFEAGSTNYIGAFHQCPNLNADNDIAVANFRVPDDFTSLDSAVMLIVPNNTQVAEDIDIYAQFASSGQAYNTHTASDLATTYDTTANIILPISYAALLAGIVPGDVVGVALKAIQGAARPLRPLIFFFDYS